MAERGGRRVAWAELKTASTQRLIRCKFADEAARGSGTFADDKSTPYGFAPAPSAWTRCGGDCGRRRCWGPPASSAYPQAKSGLVEWANAMDRHKAAPLLAVYEGDGPSFKARGVFKEFVNLDDAEVRAALRNCLGKS